MLTFSSRYRITPTNKQLLFNLLLYKRICNNYSCMTKFHDNHYQQLSIFDKTTFCLGKKQDMLVNDECCFWYNRVGHLVWVRRKEILYGDESACTTEQPHSSVHGQWHWALWQLSVIDLFITNTYTSFLYKRCAYVNQTSSLSQKWCNHLTVLWFLYSKEFTLSKHCYKVQGDYPFQFCLLTDCNIQWFLWGGPTTSRPFCRIAEFILDNVYGVQPSVLHLLSWQLYFKFSLIFFVRHTM